MISRVAIAPSADALTKRNIRRFFAGEFIGNKEFHRNKYIKVRTWSQGQKMAKNKVKKFSPPTATSLNIYRMWLTQNTPLNKAP